MFRFPHFRVKLYDTYLYAVINYLLRSVWLLALCAPILGMLTYASGERTDVPV